VSGRQAIKLKCCSDAAETLVMHRGTYSLRYGCWSRAADRVSLYGPLHIFPLQYNEMNYYGCHVSGSLPFDACSLHFYST
jgi:hypothetical protein